MISILQTKYFYVGAIVETKVNRSLWKILNIKGHKLELEVYGYRGKTDISTFGSNIGWHHSENFRVWSGLQQVWYD
jgi:hypothetical protein